MLSDTMMLGGSGRKAAYSMENSLLFRGGQYLSRTFGGGNRKTWTRGGFIRLADLTTNFQVLFACGASALSLKIVNGRVRFYLNDSGVYSAYTVGQFMDPTAWSHWHFVHDTTQPSGADYYQLWWNGVRHDLISDGGSIPLPDHFGPWNQAASHTIGWSPAGLGYFGGYMGEDYFVDGAALPPGNFGETDAVTASWRPRKATGMNYGITGFHLGKPWNSASLGTDYSGRGNHWTPSGFAASDVVLDTPTNVYATLSPLVPKWSSTSTQWSGGNLTAAFSGAAVVAFGSPNPLRSKTYIEFTIVENSYQVVGIGEPAWVGMADAGTAASGQVMLFYYANAGSPAVGRTGKGDVFRPSSPPTAPYTVQIAYDESTGNAWIGCNNVWFNSSGDTTGDPANGLNPTYTFPVGSRGGVFVAGSNYTSTTKVNFGQGGQSGLTYNSAAGGCFKYAPPSGFKSLCTANLPATIGQANGTFVGNAIVDGPYVYTGAVPQSLTINNNAVVWGTHADKLATGFKIRTSSASYNASGSNIWTATYNKQPTVGSNKTPATAQVN